MFVDRKLYKKAFEAYLRKGTPIELSVGRARPTTHYIWRTRDDGKVRSSHAAREGQVFSWDDPPVGGHPGEDYNCRCTADPYYPETSEYLRLSINGLGTKSGWSNSDFINH
ncbi:minor capsid protein [Lutimaribacter pacificus]|uniref:minor capsid protein n=1 Tax=Lutimaribacter pacificus TaxID=391948 RepID=UPI00122C6368